MASSPFSEAQEFDVVRTILDNVVYQRFNREAQPSYAGATTASIFKQMTWDRAVYQEEVYAGLPETGMVAELATIPQNAPSLSTLFSTRMQKYADSVLISKEMFDDAMHGVIPRTVEQLALKARVAQDKNAMNLFNLGATTYLTADGVTLFNTAHPLQGGGTQSNYLTGAGSALSSTSLNTAMVVIQTMKDQAGVVLGGVPKWILVPPVLFDTAIRLTNSVLVGDSSTNGVNIWRGIYGLEVYQSPYLTSSTAWFMGSDLNDVTRIVRQGLQTVFVEAKYSDNQACKYELSYREAVKVADYYGIVASAGV